MNREVALARWDWPMPSSRPTWAPITDAGMEKLQIGFWVGAFSDARCIIPMLGY